ncbi:MAG: mechanosensitive ion channel protein MscS [Flavobacteriales bacterium]|nr:MAG: mechanosensitive ion channel protein MscS [Flavobacteriales bacterium]
MKYIEHILEFELIKIANFSLSVYNLFLVLIIYFAVKGINHSIDLLIKKRLERDGVNDFVEGRSKSLTLIVKYIIYILGFSIAINSLGIDMGFVLGVFAALGLGIGFALQDVFKDLISGVIILFEGNVSVGDILEVDGLVGTVKEINLRTSLVRTRDGIYIVVPNNRIVNEKVINWSTNTKMTRFTVSVGVAYGSDTDKVKELLLKCVTENDMVSKRPRPMVAFQDFGDSALQFDVHYWILDTWQTEIVKSDLRFAIDKLFRVNNIQIPFPQRDVHVIQQ